MSHLGAFADNAAPLSCGFDARIAGIWEGVHRIAQGP